MKIDKKTMIVGGIALAIIIALVVMHFVKKSNDAKKLAMLNSSFTIDTATASTPGLQSREELLNLGYEPAEVDVIMKSSNYTSGQRY